MAVKILKTVGLVIVAVVFALGFAPLIYLGLKSYLHHVLPIFF